MKTSLRTSYVIRTLGIGIACIILGLWGVYDYVVKIPKQEEFYQRLEVCQAVKTVLETSVSAPQYGEQKARANELIVASGNFTQDRMKEQISDEQLAELQKNMGNQAIDEDTATALQDEGRLAWMLTLVQFTGSMKAPPPASTASFTGIHEQAHMLALNGIDNLEGVKKPGGFDRATQWAFILCIPFAPYLFWQFVRQRRRIYELDESGSLIAPQGRFTSEEVVDVEMGRWMSKSVATIKTASNTDVAIDDYIYKDAHLIVGAIAHRFYPDQWTTEAKQVKNEVPVEDDPDMDGFDDESDEEAAESGAVDVHGDDRNN